MELYCKTKFRVIGEALTKTKQTDENDVKVKALHAKIGELAVANDFLREKLAPWIDK